MEVKERPIIFSGEMVRQIIAGKKTMTRRVVKGRSICDECVHADNAPNNTADLIDAQGVANVAGAIFGTEPYLKTGFCEHNDRCGERIRCPYGKPGDRLWVRESFRHYANRFSHGEGFGLVKYLADNVEADLPSDSLPSFESTNSYWYKNRPSIHMPRWASRITLEITNVRVERLNDISDADCLAEGFAYEMAQIRRIESMWTLGDVKSITEEVLEGKGKEWFEAKWDKLNSKKYPWASNPFVWVIEFSKVTT